MIDPNTTIGLVSLNVENLNKLRDFYHDVMGLQIKEQSAEKVILGTSNRSLIALQQLPNGRFLPRTTGLYHLALRVPSRVALANWFRHYVGRETPHWQGASDHGVSEALYLSDPEGNGIEVYRDRPKSQWQVDANGQLIMYTHRLDLQTLMRDANGREDGIADETDMGHIHLKVADIPSAKQFYVDLLGFNLITQFADSALFVAAGDYHHHIGLNTWQSRNAPSPSADAYGLAQFELLFADQQARQATIGRLIQADYPLETTQSDPLVRDPFRHTLRLSLRESLENF